MTAQAEQAFEKVRTYDCDQINPLIPYTFPSSFQAIKMKICHSIIGKEDVLYSEYHSMYVVAYKKSHRLGTLYF